MGFHPPNGVTFHGNCNTTKRARKTGLVSLDMRKDPLVYIPANIIFHNDVHNLIEAKRAKVVSKGFFIKVVRMQCDDGGLAVTIFAA